MDERQAESKTMGDGIRCDMREGLAEVKADKKAMGDYVELKFCTG